MEQQAGLTTTNSSGRPCVCVRCSLCYLCIVGCTSDDASFGDGSPLLASRRVPAAVQGSTDHSITAAGMGSPAFRAKQQHSIRTEFNVGQSFKP
jgi:hypothetical protein